MHRITRKNPSKNNVLCMFCCKQYVFLFIIAPGLLRGTPRHTPTSGTTETTVFLWCFRVTTHGIVFVFIRLQTTVFKEFKIPVIVITTLFNHTKSTVSTKSNWDESKNLMFESNSLTWRSPKVHSKTTRTSNFSFFLNIITNNYRFQKLTRFVYFFLLFSC